jgi:mannosyl-3-phosphoglycerate phosphatase family protein
MVTHAKAGRANKPVVFTDLDGTLLDHETYSFKEALPALRLLRQRDIPLVVCSSKTRAEIEHLRGKLENTHPFTSENGGGVFVPSGYFDITPEKYGPGKYNVQQEGGYQVIRLGARYAALRKALEELRGEGFEVRGFGDMTAEEVSALTGLSRQEAVMAKERDFDEPFIYRGTELKPLIEAIEAKGFHYTKGRLLHILGDSSKGGAVDILIDLFRGKHGEIVTMALGDSPNDREMLERADYPVIVRKPDRSYDPGLDIPGVIKAEGIGPAGWNSAILKLLSSSI